MKKAIVPIFCAILMFAGGCTASAPAAELQVIDGEKHEEYMTIEKTISDYIFRVYMIDPDSYEERYIDESTEYEDMYGMILAHSVHSSIMDLKVSNIEFENNSSANAVAIMTSHYSSDTVEKGDYYIPMRVDCVLADNEWKVLSSEWLCYAPVSDYELRKNEASGYYELYPVKEDDSIVE